MALDNRLTVYNEQGNPVDYDILAKDVKFTPDGKDLPTKLAEMQTSIDDAGQVNEIIMNGQHYTPENKVIDLGTVITQHQDISGKADKSTTYTKTETDNAIANAVEGLGGGSVESVSINGGEPQLPDQNGNIDIESVDGITPHIDVVTGHWFIGDEDTGIDARGLQGNSGYTGAVGELEVVEDYTEGGVGKAASAEAVKEMAIQSIPDAGSFADAYDKARVNNVVFPWFLRDVDENGNPIEKMIWHNGYRKFVDAIGAEVEGQRNGLTIKVNADCDLLLGSKAYPLTKGKNNFPFDAEGINWDGTNAISTFDVRVGDTSTSAKNYVEEIDFGGLKISCGADFIKNWDSLKRISRLDAEMQTNSIDQFCNMDNIETIQMIGEGALFSGARNIFRMRIVASCPNLTRADLRGFNIGFVKNSSFDGIHNSFENCPKLEYADIRGIDTSNSKRMSHLFKDDTSLRTLIIGNFGNDSVSVSIENAFRGVRNCVLICTTSNPPTLNTNYDWITTTETIDGVEQDICHFSAIYVPTDAVDDYKAANGWSEYADLIDDIAGTEYEDLI